MFLFNASNRSRFSAGCLAALLVLSLSGCGSDAKGTITGKVTLNGKPVTSGIVTFTTGKLPPTSAPINKDGEYTIQDSPVGEMKITLNNAPPLAESIDPSKTATAGPQKIPTAPAGETGPIPAKYAKEGNGLTYTVKSGEQTFNIPLTP